MSRFVTRQRLIVVFVFFCCAVLALARFGPAGKAGTGTTMLVPLITATNQDSFAPGGDVDGDGRFDPSDTILYTVTINNAGTTDALNTVFQGMLDANTTLVDGSVTVSPIAADDTFSVTGNVRIDVADGASDLLANDTDPLTGGNASLTASGPTTSTSGGDVVVNANGSFSYDPPAGFTGSDSFTYTVTGTGGGMATGTVTLNVSDMIWFVQAGAGAGGDGRLNSPFNCFVGTNCFDDTTLDEAGDNIFLYAGAYTGGQTLLASQRLIGQGATTALTGMGSITGITLAPHSDALPTTGGTNPTITTSGANGIDLGSGNTIRGLTIGNTGTGTKIAGVGFGTLILGNSTLPDVTLNGTGKALDLNNGTFAATSGLSSITTTSSSSHGVQLISVGGTVSFGSTTISATTAQGIFVFGSSGNINFGNTSISNPGAEGIRLESNTTGGTRTFGSINILNGPSIGFNSGTGGLTQVTGLTTITNPGSSCINIGSATAGNGVTFANVGCTQSGGTGVSLTGNIGAVTFADLDISPDAGQRAFLADQNTGTITSASGDIVTSGNAGPFAISGPAGRTPLAMTLTSVNLAGATNVGLNLALVSGDLTIGSTTITGAAGNLVGLQVLNSASGTMNFGNTSVTGTNSVAGVRLGLAGQANAGNITFADLDIAPVSGHPAFVASDNTGTISSTSGTITSGNATAVSISGVSTAIRMPLAMVLDSVTSTGGVNNILLNNVSGTATMNGGALSGATGASFTSTGSTANVTYRGSVTNSANGISLTNNTGGTYTFAGGMSLSTGANAAFTATGGGTVNVCDESPCNPNATGALVNTLTTTTGTALNVTNTTIGANDLEFRSMSSNGAASGIVLNNTGVSGNLAVKGNGSSCTSAGTCTGGAIQNTTSDGVSLTSTMGVSLTRLFVGNSGRHGINTASPNGLTLTSCYIDDSGDADNEYGLNLTNASNAVTIDGTTFNGAADNLVYATTATTLNLTVSNGSSFSYPASVSGTANSAILIEPSGSGSATAMIQNSTFTNIVSASAQIGSNTAGATGTHNFTFSNNTINVTLPMRGSGISVSGQELTTTNITINNNNFTGAGGNGVINIDTNDTSTVRGTVNNNTITNPPGIGMFIAVDEAGKNDITVNGNTLTNTGGDGIQTVNFGGTGVSTMDLFITNNQVNGHSANTAVNFVGGIAAFALSAPPEAGDATCVAIRGNTVTGTPPSPTQCGAPCVDYYVDEAAGQMTFEEIPNTANATLNGAYLTSINDPGPVSVFGMIDLTNGASCNIVPRSALPESRIASDGDQIWTAGSIITLPSTSPKMREFLRSREIHKRDQELKKIKQQPISGIDNNIDSLDARYQSSSALIGAFIQPVNYTIMPVVFGERSAISGENDATYGEKSAANGNTIQTDSDLRQSGNTLRQTGNGSGFSAEDYIVTAEDHDLTAQEHNLTAHDDDIAADALYWAVVSDIAGKKIWSAIAPTVSAQEQMAPLNAEAQEDAPEGTLQTVCVDGDAMPATCVGPGFTLPAGKTVTITYQAILNPVPTGQAAYTTVSNQGSVSGSNFGTVMTDDPDTGTSGDATVSDIDHTTVAVTSDTNPATFGEPVTFTATLTGVPTRASDPPGTVTFRDNGVDISGPIAVVAGATLDNVSTAAFTTSTLAFGNHTITADYSGGGPAGLLNYNANTGTLTGDPQVIGAADTTTTIDTHLPNPSSVGQNVTVTYSVAPVPPGMGTPTGSVTVTADTLESCTASVAASECMLALNTVGMRTLTAVYTPDTTNYNGSMSAGVSHTVNAPSPVVYVNSAWVAVPDGMDPDGMGPATQMGFDAFATIEQGVAGVATGGMVIVYPGTYTGNVDVDREMALTGSFTTTGTLTISSADATVSPGLSPGIIASGDYTMITGSELDIEIGGTTPGTEHDQIDVTGTVSINGAVLNLSSFSGYVPPGGSFFTIINNDDTDPVVGTFSGLPEGTEIPSFLGSTLTARISYVGGDGNDVVVTVDGTTSGRVTYLTGAYPVPPMPTPTKPVPDVTVTAFDGFSTIADITDANGDYSLTGFGMGSYTITPTKTPYAVNSFNGIFSNDATVISQHVVGLITLNADQLKAARVSGLPNVSSFEAALIAQYLVGITNPINKSGQWVFTPESTMPDTTLNNTQDYQATLFGDVNGDWDPMGARPAEPLTDPERISRAVHVTTGSHRAVSGTEIIIPLKIENLRGTGVTSYQFDIEYDPAVLSPAQVIADLTGTIGEGLSIAYNSPEKGLIKVVAYGAFPVMGDGTYVNLRFHVNGKPGTMSSLVITAFRFNDGRADVLTTDGEVRVR